MNNHPITKKGNPMRRIIESTLLSLDGVIGSPHLWASPRFDEEARAAALAQLRASDAMLMGRKTYEIFSGLWPNQTGSYADAINAIPKYVFSSTLTDTHWSNSRIVRGEVATEVERMKQQAGRDLVIYGHGPLGAELLERGLLDELQFAIHPVFVGEGTTLRRHGATASLELTGTKTLGTGVVVVTYRPAEA
jgi:dihydrofolate reductase